MKTLIAACLLWAAAAMAATDAGAPVEGKETKESKPGPDISKMPFTPESITQVVAAYQEKVQGCYEESLAAKGKKVVEGKLQAHWVITAEGVVKGAKILKKGTTLNDPKLNECVVAVLLTMEFPKPPKNQDQPIDFPFKLKAIK
jgi:hypothetical protein